MLARILSGTVMGIEGTRVCVETEVSPGLQAFHVVGLPEAAVRESRLRVQSAIRNSGFRVPKGKITVNLAPAELPKSGALLDLPIAISVLVASGQLPREKVHEIGFVGELGLNGELREGRGLLPVAAMGMGEGWKGIVIPATARESCTLLPEKRVLYAHNLIQAIALLSPVSEIEVEHLEPIPDELCTQSAEEIRRHQYFPDMADVAGQERAKRAALIAAAGNHNILFSGPPGCGKSMIAERIPGILPKMTSQEALQVQLIRSVAGHSGRQVGDIWLRPFRAPHHSATPVAMVGGGTPIAPGEISLAHQGVLFLDELPEFSRGVIESLRQPIEAGVVNISRANSRCTLPASFLLVGAMNPCPCGYWGVEGRVCECSEERVQRYLRKISGPIMDRMELYCPLLPMNFDAFGMAESQLTSASMRSVVERVRRLQSGKRHDGFACQKKPSVGALISSMELTDRALDLLRQIIDRGQVSGRGLRAILRVSQTIADIESSHEVDEFHVGEALAYRVSSRTSSSEVRITRQGESEFLASGLEII